MSSVVWLYFSVSLLTKNAEYFCNVPGTSWFLSFNKRTCQVPGVYRRKANARDVFLFKVPHAFNFQVHPLTVKLIFNPVLVFGPSSLAVSPNVAQQRGASKTKPPRGQMTWPLEGYTPIRIDKTKIGDDPCAFAINLCKAYHVQAPKYKLLRFSQGFC